MTTEAKEIRPGRLRRADYARFVPVTTRWHDNDVYGHINNVVYYAFFDTAVNQILVQEGVLDLASSPVVGLVVETRCTYFESIAFPEAVEIGVAAAHIGRSSVRYRVGVFKAGAPLVAAQGDFTHVYVERASQTPVPISADLRKVLEGLVNPSREA